MSPRRLLVVLALATLARTLPAADVRPIPPPGIAVPEADRAELEKGVAALAAEIADLRKASSGELPNVEIFHKAVDWALRYGEFFDVKQLEVARQLLAEGNTRAAALKKGETPWNQAPGLVVRAYRSEIDGSVQPYGLVLPDDWKPGETTARPLHFWCHGRGENLSELSFVNDRLHNKGEFTPPGAIVCHLYGRFCCANKFAGERDLFEALADIKKHYAIDDARLVIRGFSMGGASTWQFATHFPGMWVAAAPGAGFAETAEFFHVFAPGKTPPPWWEQVLWRWYDCTTMAANLVNTKTVAYSGEIDGQKQASDIMVKYAKEEGLEFPHIIGPQTGHKYHPDSKPKIEELITEAVKNGSDPNPENVHLTTYSLIYPEVKTVRIEGIEKQWERADVDCRFDAEGVLQVKTRNVSRFSLTALKRPSSKQLPLVVIDGQQQAMDGKVRRTFSRSRQEETRGRWAIDRVPEAELAGKRPGLSGPIDHAFMSRFIFVSPSGPALNEKVGAWAKSELNHATDFWRKVFRGSAPLVPDDQIDKEAIANSNLVLFGDPSSNAVIKKIIEKLPLKWTADTLEFRGVKYDVATHVPVLIFPNPLNPEHYVVINSGPTFREEALLNNSDQTPKLPDWAIINITTPPDAKWPGLVIDAGFFDEQWKP